MDYILLIGFSLYAIISTALDSKQSQCHNHNHNTCNFCAYSICTWSVIRQVLRGSLQLSTDSNVGRCNIILRHKILTSSIIDWPASELCEVVCSLLFCLSCPMGSCTGDSHSLFIFELCLLLRLLLVFMRGLQHWLPSIIGMRSGFAHINVVINSWYKTKPWCWEQKEKEGRKWGHGKRKENERMKYSGGLG